MKFLKNQSSVFMIAGIMAVVVTAFSALILLLTGCGSTDPEPAVVTPPPTNESAIHQEPEPTDVHTTDVHTTFSEADIDTSDWVTLDIETGTISIPPTWEYEYGNWGSLNFNGEGATSDTIFMGIGDITMGMDLVAFAEFVNAADSSQPFVFNDGFVGFILEYQTHMSWVRSDSYQGLNFTHGGARSHFVNNEDIITAIAKSFVTGGFEESTPTETSEASSAQQPQAHDAGGWHTISQTGWTLEIPVSWRYEILHDGPGEELALVNDDGSIRLFVGYIIAGDPQWTVDENPSQAFHFGNGNIGYMIDAHNSIMWVHRSEWGPSCCGISFYHGGNRTLFERNEDVLLRIARSLRES